MNNLSNIQLKLHKFINKYYKNELIKGILLFFAIGLLYFIITLFIEYFLWLNPFARTILFWIFILVEIGLFGNYILIPIFKLFGLKKGISDIDASKIIGKHFPEVSDKLLNMIQLNNSELQSELIEASIEQKSRDLQAIPFKRAVDFSGNKKYIKYTLVPLLIWLMVYVTGNSTILNDSFSRVVHYNTAYQPPAPFTFKVLNKSFDVIEGESFTLQIETVGNIIPDNAKIHFSNENYYLENKKLGFFEYNFTRIKEPFEFFIEANGVVSKVYQINMIATPVITKLKMEVNYPVYTGKRSEIIENTGNAIVPQGTNITWIIEAHQATDISYILNENNSVSFVQKSNDLFSYTSNLVISTNYKIATSNENLINYETLNFQIEVISDEYPKIIVKSDIDSISRGPVQFVGQLSDDYGLNKLQLVYYNKLNPKRFKTHIIDISKSSFTDFYYSFPNGILIEEGVEYEFYFEVFDNDAVNGNKKTKSRVFSYYNKTEKELKEELLKEQKETISTFSKTLEKAKEANSQIEKFKNELQKKSEINWNDSKKIEQFIARQNQYQEMFQKQTNKLDQNLNEQSTVESLIEKKEELKKRIEETKKLADQEKMLKELEELSRKLDKENLTEKLKEIAQKNKQNEQSLERILELTKRFYVEQKTNQIAEKLDKLADKEYELAKKVDEENSSEKQKDINNEFEEIKKDFDELEKQNRDLMRPMKLPDNSEEKDEIDKDLQDALEELNNEMPEPEDKSESSKSKAKKSQKAAAKKMKEMSKSMQNSMEIAEGESIDENIEDLRKIVENLIEFSFQQETLLDNFSNLDNNHPEFPKNLKQQNILKEYFEHIDDSIYMLSLRLVKIGGEIQKEVNDAHFNIDESLLNFSENRILQGVSNQHFVITAANNLGNNLSNILESLMNASPSMGKGKGNEKGFSLPDIIKKQEELTEKMKEGMNRGDKPGDEKGDGKGNKSGEGNGENDNEQRNEALYEMYKEQAEMRRILEEMLGVDGEKSGKNFGEAIKKMEELEIEMLERGFSKEVVEKMQEISYELLKLEEARKEQGEDQKRKSETNLQIFDKRNIDKLKLQNQYFNYYEILNRQSLPLRTIYKKKVQEYFKTEQ